MYMYNLFQSDEVFLEAQVQNKTAGAIHLEKVSFETSHLFRGKCIFLTCVQFYIPTSRCIIY